MLNSLNGYLRNIEDMDRIKLETISPEVINKERSITHSIVRVIVHVYEE